MPDHPNRFTDFESLKRSVPILKVLDRYGITASLRRRGDDLCGPCPLHHGHNPTQFRVSLSKNVFNCFGDCHGGGSALDFVAKAEKVGIREAAILIADWFVVNPLPEIRSRSAISEIPAKARTDETGVNEPLDFKLTHLDQSHPYLAERGLKPETVEAFGIGYCPKGIMAGRIVIPIHDAEARLVAYVGRWPGVPPEGVPKYRFPAGFRKSLEVFNLHRARSAPASEQLVVVEGFFAAVSLWQSGFRRVVCVMGSSVSDAQARKIAAIAPPNTRVTILFDEDNAGRAGREQAVRKLSPLVRARAVSLSRPGLQPDMLSPAELEEILK